MTDEGGHCEGRFIASRGNLTLLKSEIATHGGRFFLPSLVLVFLIYFAFSFAPQAVHARDDRKERVSRLLI